MRYAKLKKNDIANGPGIGVSLYTQGCPHCCPGCFNPETWDFNGGQEFTYEVLQDIISALTENNVPRHLSILGGEPMCPENVFLTNLVITKVKEALPQTEIYLWTGYLFEELKSSTDPQIQSILSSIDCLIDGKYQEEERDITLSMRGSKNQKIYYLKKS